MAQAFDLVGITDKAGAPSFAAGSSKIEPGTTPARPVTLKWETFTDAANEAGMSRRYGGIHFRAADLAGRFLGRLVVINAWTKAQSYFDGADEIAVPAPNGRVDLEARGVP